MIPRQPPEGPDDTVQEEVLQAVHDALNETLATDASDVTRLLAEVSPSASLLQQTQAAENVDVEIDRLEAYLKGPTAFTA